MGWGAAADFASMADEEERDAKPLADGGAELELVLA
jgi:hypothetical protein